MKYTLTSSGAKFIYLSNIDGETSNAVQGGDSIYIYGAQLEQGSYPTSYIPTSGSSATRQADTANGGGNSEVFNDSEGVLYAEIAGLADGTSKVITLGDGTNSNRVQIFYHASNVLYGNIVSGGNGQVTGFTYNGSIDLFKKVVVKYKSNDCAFWVNGFEIETDTTATMPSGLNELMFDNGTGSSNFYGNTKEIAYYDTILTDEELEVLTSYETLTELVTELNLNEL